MKDYKTMTEKRGGDGGNALPTPHSGQTCSEINDTAHKMLIPR